MVASDKGQDGDSPRGWSERVHFGTAGRRTFAYRPGRVLVARAGWERLDREEQARVLRLLGGAAVAEGGERGPVVLDGVSDAVRAAAALVDEGIVARVDHVYFAAPTSAAPVMFGGAHGTPVMFGGANGAPVMFGSAVGSPVMFGGADGAPVMFGGADGMPVLFGGGHACGCGTDVGPGSETPESSTALGLPEPVSPRPTERRPCRVVVVDTGLAAKRFRPAALEALGATGAPDVPDADADGDLDAAAGHSTFIAGIVAELAPDAEVDVVQVLTTHGDGSDSDIAEALWAIVDDPPDIVNLSFAGYSDDDTVPLAIREPLQKLLDGGVVLVAAAGNDATCRPAWPASMPGVIAVGAVGTAGPAWFSNHGPHVRACAPGVDVISRFFDAAGAGADDAGHVAALDTLDADGVPAVDGFARWSGTSFAAPIVAGVLARTIGSGVAPADAVGLIIDAPGLLRLQGFGTVVNERPW